MTYIINFFKSIADTIIAIIHLIVHGFTSMISLLGIIPNMLSLITTMFSMIPDPLIPYCMITVTIMIIWGFKKAVG